MTRFGDRSATWDLGQPICAYYIINPGLIACRVTTANLSIKCKIRWRPLKYPRFPPSFFILPSSPSFARVPLLCQHHVRQRTCHPLRRPLRRPVHVISPLPPRPYTYVVLAQSSLLRARLALAPTPFKLAIFATASLPRTTSRRGSCSLLFVPTRSSALVTNLQSSMRASSTPIATTSKSVPPSVSAGKARTAAPLMWCRPAMTATTLPIIGGSTALFSPPTTLS